MKLLYIALTLILLAGSSVAQEPAISCSVKYGKTDTTLSCSDGKKRVIPRNVLRFIDCKTVNLQRGVDGKVEFAPDQLCHIIDSGVMIAACEEWQASQKAQAGYDLARNPTLLYLPNCTYWWTNVEGEQALVNVYQMMPLKPKAKRK